jgi:histone H1/5
VAATLLTKGAGLIVTTTGGVTKRLGLSDTTIGSRSVRPQPALTLAAKARVTGIVLPAANGAGEKKTAAAPESPAGATKRTRPAVEKRVVEATTPAEPAQLELLTPAPAKKNASAATKKSAPAAKPDVQELPISVPAKKDASVATKKAAPAAKPATTATVEPSAQLQLPIGEAATDKKAKTAAKKSPAATDQNARAKATESTTTPAPAPAKKRSQTKKPATDA